MSKEAMKLALEALEYIEHNYMSLPAPAEKAITALREALASEAKEQPRAFGTLAQQEPVAWRYTDARGHYRYRGFVANFDKKYPMLKPQPLYTPPPARQEPVAWRYLTKYKDQSVCTYCAFEPTSRETWEALYTSPPAQRTWVGLTPEQAVDLYKATETDNRMVLIDAVEAKLRSKNEDRN